MYPVNLADVLTELCLCDGISYKPSLTGSGISLPNLVHSQLSLHFLTTYSPELCEA